ncbi:MAG: hypothetical protein C4294_04465, partial [Nitrospiraceae bacterium]
EGWYDCTSPYGYSTPLVAPSQDSLPSFLKAFRKTACERGLVTAFFRLHPLLVLNHDSLGKFGRIARHGQTVYIDLSQSREQIRAQIARDHRRNIRNLLKRGFRVIADDWSLFRDFVDIYQSTMRRLGASQAYLFSREYFEEFRSVLGGRVHLCCVLSQTGEVACAGLFVVMGEIVQFHLMGTAAQYLPLAPSKLMVDFICGWAQGIGAKVFHMGGGLGGTADSLFKFKAGFSKMRGECFTYRMILDEEKNDRLIRFAEASDGGTDPIGSNFFPAYRRPPLALRNKSAGDRV